MDQITTLKQITISRVSTYRKFVGLVLYKKDYVFATNADENDPYIQEINAEIAKYSALYLFERGLVERDEPFNIETL